MPLAPLLAPLLAGFAVIVTGFVLYAMHEAAGSWLRPLLNALSGPRPGESLAYTIAAAPARSVWAGIRWVFHKARHGISHALALQLLPLTLWLQALGNLWDLVTRASTSHVVATADALHRFRTTVIPRQIHHALAPVKAIAVGAEALGRRSISLNHREAAERKQSIDRIHHRWLWPLALAFGGIDAMLRRDLLHRSRTDHRDLTHVRTRDLPRVRGRLGRLERTTVKTNSRAWRKLLALTTVAGLATAVRVGLSRLWPWTRCNEFSRLSRLLNCSHFGWLAGLLELALSFLVVTDAKVVAEAAIRVEDAMDGTIRALAEPSAEVTAVTQAAMDILTKFI